MPPTRKPDYYATLGVDPTADVDQVKRAYRRLAVQWHPDKNPDNKQEAETKFKEIAEAYEVLSDPQKRQRYDSGQDPTVEEDHAYEGSGGVFGRGASFRDPFEIFNAFFQGVNPFGDGWLEDDFVTLGGRQRRHRQGSGGGSRFGGLFGDAFFGFGGGFGLGDDFFSSSSGGGGGGFQSFSSSSSSSSSMLPGGRTVSTTTSVVNGRSTTRKVTTTRNSDGTIQETVEETISSGRGVPPECRVTHSTYLVGRDGRRQLLPHATTTTTTTTTPQLLEAQEDEGEQGRGAEVSAGRKSRRTPTLATTTATPPSFPTPGEECASAASKPQKAAFAHVGHTQQRQRGNTTTTATNIRTSSLKRPPPPITKTQDGSRRSTRSKPQ